GRSRRPNAPKRGADLSQNVNLTFSEAFFGVEKEIEITRDEICGTCNGKGAEPGTSTTQCAQCNGRGEIRQTRQTFLGAMVQVITCPVCKGTGEIITTPCHTCKGRGIDRKTVRKTVPIPAGVDNGTQIRLAGEGNNGLNGGPNGNLYLELRVKAHEFFKRKDNDLLLDLDINVAQATLGAEINIPTMEGTTKLDIPAGTQSGKVFRVRNKGFADMRGSTNRGDLVAVINVEVPTHLNAEQRELFEKLAQTLGTEVKPQGKGFLDTLKEVFGG
ncbi:MAG TPA: DnaJ C-terminal domain-containing protein, partial [Bellilinea sp.]|nr:DnaJ C-terminal domain-containing protein [Bellilinea sp.]